MTERRSVNRTTELAPIRADTAALCALVIVAPQLIGGAFPWSVVVIAGLSVVALGAAVWARRTAASPVIDCVFITMVLAWVWTCLQAVPLPARMAARLNLGSATAAERLRELAWAGEIPFTISYDPGATLLQIVVGIVIAASFLAARLGGPSGLKPIAVATVASAVLLGLVGLMHQASGLDALFGLYSPRFTTPRLLTPLMNNNHLAGFLLMGALIAIGLAAREGGRSRRLWIAASVLCSIVLAWTLSRGAIGGLAFGLFALAAWLTGSKRTERRRGAIPVAIGSAAIAGAVVFAGLEPILRRFEMQGFDKLQTAVGALGLLEGSAWWLGVGRGAFSSAFVEREGSLARYTHPENLVVQWTTEWGVPIATVLLVVVVWALWKRIRTTDDPLVAAVCIAIFALSLQNLVDFSLEMAGVVAVVASLLGALIPASGDPSPRSSWRLALVSLGLFAVTLAALGPRVVRSDTQSIVDQLARSMQADDEAVFQATLRRGLALHPGEPALALLAGTYAGIKERRDAARWLSVVMEEAPGWAAPHAVAARWLFAEGRTDQALVEIREAEQRHAGSGLEVLCQILTGFPSMEHAERAAPSPELRVDYLARTASCPHLPAELRAEIDGAILRAEPTHRGALLRQSRRLVAQKQADDAVELLEDALQRHPSDGPLWVALIRTHLASGDGNQARRALQEARSSGVETRSLLEAQARVEAALGEADAMRSTTARLRGQARGDTGLIARSFMLEGELQASLGNIDEALAAYLAADEASPEAPALRRAAALALKSGRISQARRIYRTLCARTPESSACAQEARLAE